MPIFFNDKLFYRLQPKRHYCYLIWCPTEKKAKIGRTCRLHHRLKNLRASLWVTNEEVYVIRVHNSNESLKLERFLHKAFASRHVVREWYGGVTPEDVAAVLTHNHGFGHLLLAPHEKPEDVVPILSRQESCYDIRLD